MSAENGLEHFKCFKRSVDRWKFADFLTELKRKMGDDKVCLLFDQLSVHRTHHVRDKLAEVGYDWVMNACYYPMGNPIEYCFA